MSKFESIVDILLVEDNPNDAELAIRSLKKHNLANHLVWVKDGEEALDFLFCRGAYSDRKKTNPKIVMLDLRLPKVDGLEVLKAIRENEETQHLPVVILTSSKEEQDVINSYNLGVNSYVPKPVSFDDFAKTVAELGMYWVVINELPVE
ncbi:MAG: response regulator [Spirochaetales bacterium]|nr:response regulator [Spirochaetales bacterium]